MPDPAKTFRVSTVSDFNPQQQQRRFATNACRMCRIRKVKCRVLLYTGHQDSDQRCQACKQSDLECLWDKVDRRKRRKARATQGPRNGRLSGRSQTILAAENIARQHETSKARDAALLTGEPSEQTELQDVEDRGHDWPLQIGSPSQTVLLDPNSGFFDTVADHLQRESSPFPQHRGDPLAHDSLQAGRTSMEWPDNIEDFLLDLGPLELPENFNFDEGRSRSIARSQTTWRKPIRLRIFRHCGPTAVAPGLNKLAIAIEASPNKAVRSESGPLNSAEGTHAGRLVTSSHASSSPQQDTSQVHFYGLPPEMIHEALESFFNHFGGHFPFLNKKILAGHVHSRNASKFLINAILALTARFCTLDVSTPLSFGKGNKDWHRGANFLKKAKEQLMSLLAVPAPDVVAGLVLLAWAEYGNNNEAGLWMFSGMAIRMVQDLGMHRCDATDSDPNPAFFDHAPLSPQGEAVLTDEQSAHHQQKARLVMFWSVFNMDVYVSLLMGRTPTIKRAEIEVPLPTPDDMKVAQLDFWELLSIRNVIFPEMVNCMIIFAEALDILNSCKLSEEAPKSDCLQHDLCLLQKKLVQRHQSLDSRLHFNPSNYKEASRDGHAGIFLMLHQYLHTILSLLMRETQRCTIADTQLNYGKGVALIACQKIVQSLNIADSIDDKGYASTPFLTHCIFVASSIILDDVSAADRDHSGDDFYLNSMQGDDLEYLCQKLLVMRRYFYGVTKTLEVIERRRRIFQVEGGCPGSHDIPDEESDPGSQDVLELDDGGIVNRYTIH